VNVSQHLRDAVAFSLLPRIGGGAFRLGVEQHGSAAEAFRRSGASESERLAAVRGADELLERCGASGATVLPMGEPAYPVPLLDLPQPPSLLFTLGDVALAGRRSVGIVGTRHSSLSGERIAHRMASAFAQAGVVVVSGMALGIDAAAHRGAMDAGGGTIAVQGGGADVPYPPTHAALHQRIVQAGLVLSEAPIGSRPVKGAFPRRNRIIAALSELLIVVEAGDRSGALITSGIALELGRSVAAVPGPIDSPRHVGSNRLLSEGASFIGTVDDALLLMGVDIRAGEAAEPVAVDSNDRQHQDHETHAAILEAVRAGASDLDGLALATGLPAREFATAISTLELRGRLLVTATGAVARTDRG
jgi:DNA processing protein